MVRRIKKIIVGFFLAFLLLLVLAPLIIQTRPFKSWLASLLEKNVNKNLNATLSIGRIDGNFFSALYLQDIVLTAQQDTIARIPGIAVEYSLRHLLQKSVVLHKVAIDSPFFNIQQDADSTWNVQKIIPETEPKQEQTPSDTTGKQSGFEWRIELESFQLDGLHAKIAALDSLVPQRINYLNISTAGLFSELEKRINLQNMSLCTSSPDFTIQQFVFLLEQDPSGMSLKNFRLETRANQITAQADADMSSPRSGQASLSTTPVNLAEFRFVLPTIRVQGQPRLFLESRLQNDQLDADVVFKSPKSSLSFRAEIGNFSYLLGDSTKPQPRYQVNGSINNINVSDWTTDISSTIRLNGDIRINGSGITPESADATAVIQLTRSEFEDRSIDSLRLRAKYVRGDASANINLRSSAGRLDAQANVQDVLSSPRYETNIAARNLNLEYVLLDSAFNSDLNFDLYVSGNSFDPDDITGNIMFSGYPSQFYDVQFDTIGLQASIQGQTFDIANLMLETKAAEAHIRGIASLTSDSDLMLELQSKNLMAINQIIQSDTIAGTLNLAAHIRGKPDSLDVDVSLTADSLMYNSYVVNSLELSGDFMREPDSLKAAAIADIRGILLDNVFVENVHLDTDYTPERINLELNLQQSDSIRAFVHGQYWLHDLPIIYIKQLNVDIQDRRWRGGSDSTSIVVGDEEYLITNFRIRNMAGDSVAAEINADGGIRFKGDQDFSFSIKNYNLAPIGSFLQSAGAMDGVLNLDVQLDGTATSPQLSLVTNLTDARYNQIRIAHMRGDVRYDNNKITADVLVTPRADSLRLQGFVPATLSLAEKTINIHDSKPFEVSLFTDDLPLQNITYLRQWLDEHGGNLSINLKAQNTLSNIQPGGAISLQKGRFLQEQFGFAVQDADMRLGIKQDSLILNNFSAQQDEGAIDISGFAALDSSIFTGILNALQLKVNANNFYVSQKPEHELAINSNIDIHGPVDSLQMDGSLEIVRASIYLPAITQTAGAPSRTVQTPLLVKATTAAKADTIVIDSVQQAETKIKAPPIMANLRGSIDVSLPKNVWIRNDNFRVEIGGDIEIIKNSAFFEIFGAINILRGQYDFLGRRFKLEEGTVSFQGGEQINPMVNLVAEYNFRDSQRDKRIINLIITGQAMNPEISFKLDEQNITEGEAVSYILFNRSPEQVGMQQDGNGVSQTGYLATDLVYGMLSAELSRRFGEQLGVDYIEIKGEDNLSAATFVVGKYITPDLFMSYEHSIGAMEEDRTPQVVTIEYELTKFIFLQLVSGDTKNSGADIIFKFDKKVD